MNKVKEIQQIDIHPSWKEQLAGEFRQEYFSEIKSSLLKERNEGIRIYPKGKDILNAFKLCPFNRLKVVILGQDPYHGPGQAHGLCFSVPAGVAFPPSLVNIFKELHDDVGKPLPEHGDLSLWAEQGVFLLNAILTVRAHQAASHRDMGWQKFTDRVISIISERLENVVFFLWGSFAQHKAALIDKHKHLILKSPHPSPLSAYRGFFGNKHFSHANSYLLKNGKEPIVW